MLQPVRHALQRPNPRLFRWIQSTANDHQAALAQKPLERSTISGQKRPKQGEKQERDSEEVVQKSKKYTGKFFYGSLGATDKKFKPTKVKRNDLGVQLLSRQLHEQIFKNVSFPAPQPSYVHIAKEHLEMHGLDPSQGSVLPDTGFTLPQLQGSNLLEHFYRIGAHAAQPWLSLANEHAQSELPPQPDDWEIQSGWTKYHYRADGSSFSEHVPYPMHDGKPEEMLTFDVETMYKYSPYPIMATAASRNGWYCWISPWLLGETEETQHLIPFGDPTVPRIIVGHNVSYDRGRILEEYNINASKNRFLDTMALHVAVKGISSHQRPAWMKYRKSKETESHQQQEAVEAVIGLIHVVKTRLEVETDETKREELSRVLQEMQNSLPQMSSEALVNDSSESFVDTNAVTDPEVADVEQSSKRWEELTSANSLADVAKLHCGIIVDKDIRNDFGTSTREEILDNITDYLTYCANDVDVTHKVYSTTLTGFLAGCPHPVSFAGILTMGSSFLTVNEEWENYLNRAEGVYRDMEEGVKRKLKALAQEAKALMNTEGVWQNDPWLSQLDWTPKVAGKSRGIIAQEVLILLLPCP